MASALEFLVYQHHDDDSSSRTDHVCTVNSGVKLYVHGGVYSSLNDMEISKALWGAPLSSTETDSCCPRLAFSESAKECSNVALSDRGIPAIVWRTQLAIKSHDVAADGFFIQGVNSWAFVAGPSVCFRGGIVASVPIDEEGMLNSTNNPLTETQQLLPPVFDHVVLSASISISIMEKLLPSKMLDAFDRLRKRSSPISSILWRFAVLYEYGGIYVDPSYPTISSPKNLIGRMANTMTPYPCQLMITTAGTGLPFTADAIVSERGHPFMKFALEKVVDLAIQDSNESTFEGIFPDLVTTFFKFAQVDTKSMYQQYGTNLVWVETVGKPMGLCLFPDRLSIPGYDAFLSDIPQSDWARFS